MNTQATLRGAANAPAHPHIAALDGLRFIAAGTVLFSHGFFYLLLNQDNAKITAYNAPFVGMANIGMTLFFVLSGFVIHYNYAASVPLPGGVRAFFVARFARLYPLFLLVFLICIVNSFRYAGGKVDIIGPIPLFLTFTQSWWFWAFGGRATSEAYSDATGLMWSLSTEAFFYAIYTVAGAAIAPVQWDAPGLGRLHGCFDGGVAGRRVDGISGSLNGWAALYTGNVVAAGNFSHWLIYNSPWIRIFEFLLGALTAQFVMTTHMEPMRARIAGCVALVVILAAYCYCLINLLPLSGCITTCVAGAFAILIGASAAKGHVFSSALSNRWMVMGGEASYSLYLLHYWVMHDLGHRLADNRPVLIRAGVFVVLMLVSVGIARVSYLIYERPMIRIVRWLFSARPRAWRHDETSYVSPAVAVQPVVVPPKEWGVEPYAALGRSDPNGAPQ